jgi:DNA invertase Pin-like site-specific DNA recombinase
MRVALYARVSTEEQAIHGLSIGVQQENLKKWANENHHTIVDVYVDAGISARKPASKRPDLQRLLNDVRADKIEMIVFTKLDRWFRNVKEYYKVQDVLDEHRVCWKTIEEEYETETSAGRFKVNIMLSVAESEADRTSERIKTINKNKRENGLCHHGTQPLGLKIVKGKLVEDPETAPVVRDVFRHFIATQSVTSTGRYLLSEYGITRSYKNTKQMLKNKRYIGVADNGEQLYPPIVPPQDFALAQSIMAERSTRHSGDFTQRHIYLFTGIVFCAECGRRLSGTMSHVHGGEYVYYKCPSYAGRSCVHRRREREDDLEQYMVDHIISGCIGYNVEVAQQNASNQPTVDKAAIRRKMEKLKDLYLSDLIERDVYVKDYTSLRKQLEAPEPEEKEQIDVDALKSTMNVYGGLEPSERREFWRRTVKKISVSNDGEINFELVGYI